MTETHIVIISSVKGCVVDIPRSPAGFTVTRRRVFTVVTRVAVPAVATVAVFFSFFSGVYISTIVWVLFVGVTQVGVEFTWRLSYIRFAKVTDVIRRTFALGISVVHQFSFSG